MPKTTLRTIKYSDFVAMCETESKRLEKSPDAEALALLASNMEAVKDQGGETMKGDELVAIQVVAKVDVEARLAALEAKVADLSAKISTAASAGDGKKGKEKDGTEKSIAGDLGAEALEALISKLDRAKVLLTAGTLTGDEFNKIFDGWWTLRDAIQTYAAIAADTAKTKAEKEVAEKTAAEKKAADEAAEKIVYEKMTDEEKKAFDKKKADEKAAAEKAASEKAEADKKAAGLAAKQQTTKSDPDASDGTKWNRDLAGPRLSPKEMFARAHGGKKK